MPIQFGLDIATGVSITAALIGAVYKINKDRKIRISDNSKSIIVKNINNQLIEMAKEFSLIAKLVTRIEKECRYEVEGVDNTSILSEGFKAKHLDLDEKLGLFKDLIQSLERFFDNGEVIKYTSYSSLYSIGNELKSVRFIKDKSTSLINTQHQALSLYGYVNIINKISKSILEDTLSTSNEELVGLIKIFLGHELTLEYINKNFPDDIFIKHTNWMQKKNSDIGYMSSMVFTISRHFQEKPEYFMSIALSYMSRESHHLRRECKKYLVTLAAFSCKMQQEKNNESIEDIYLNLSGEDYLDVEKTIR